MPDICSSGPEMGKYGLSRVRVEYEYRPFEYEYEYEYRLFEYEYEYEYRPLEYEYEYEYHQDRTRVRVSFEYCKDWLIKILIFGFRTHSFSDLR
jgi:hypothetical protein